MCRPLNNFIVGVLSFLIDSLEWIIRYYGFKVLFEEFKVSLYIFVFSFFLIWFIGIWVFEWWKLDNGTPLHMRGRENEFCEKNRTSDIDSGIYNIDGT